MAITISTNNAIMRSGATLASPLAELSAVDASKALKYADAGGRSTTSTVSTLGRQLADAAERAAKRDATLSRSELRDHAKAAHEQLSAHSRPPLKARADSYVPDTSDPELIARAKQATDFVNRVSNVSNPFAELSRDELYLIQYDDSKTFSMNEREAARMEMSRRDEIWTTALFANDSIERSLTGRGPTFFKTILEDVQSLPPIARAMLPIDYEVQLMSHIAREERGATADNALPEPFDLMAYLFPEGVEPDERFRYYPLKPYDPGTSSASAVQPAPSPPASIAAEFTHSADVFR